MKVNTKLRTDQLFLPIGFGWYTGSKYYAKKLYPVKTNCESRLAPHNLI